MTIVDDRGRVFGRMNRIDAGLILVVIVLVPLVYAAYALSGLCPRISSRSSRTASSKGCGRASASTA